MTDTVAERAATPQAPPTEPPAAAPAGAAATPARGHTPGGLPAVPLALTTANSVVALASAATLATGPVAVLAAGAGAAASAVLAARTARAARTLARTSATRRTADGRVSGGPHTSRLPESAARGVPRQGRPSATPPTATAGRGTRPPVRNGGPAAVRGAAGPAHRPGAVDTVRALRQAARQETPTRQGRRLQASADRRQAADARRAAGRQVRDLRHAGRGPAAKAAAAPLRAARRAAGRAADRARDRARSGRDRRTAEKVTAVRRLRRTLKARRAARASLLRSAARFHARRLLAAALAAPVGLLGVLATLIGRRMGWSWMVHPGRRLYRHLVDQARQARAERDAAIRGDLCQAETDADASDAGEAPGRVADTVPRAPKNHTAHQPQGEPMSGFDFSDAATEMHAAALSYEPDGMMQVLAAFETMPEALTTIANTFGVIAERSDSEFPLDKLVGEALNEVYNLLMQAATASEEVVKTFRAVHEADIARLEDPRAGEEKWDTTANDE
ncbi:hypothetical protein ACIQGZ_02355 [Streptomyces sp. NPDC092296]|uniref:hypothetical protein n=1 Tax=Streptomyces sp. NPDC092296 TaxID=3366012 RepID=UPI0037FAD472